VVGGGVGYGSQWVARGTLPLAVAVRL